MRMKEHLIEMQACQSMKLLFESNHSKLFVAALKLGIQLWQESIASFGFICYHLAG